MRFRALPYAIALMSLLAWPGSSPAQGLDGRSSIVVRLASPVSGLLTVVRTDDPGARVDVELGSPTVAIPALEPGVYDLHVLQGSGPSHVALRVTVPPVSVVSVDARTATNGSIQLTLGRTDRAEGVSFDRVWLEDLPSARDVWALIETSAPFVIADRMDGGGLGLGRSARLGVRGSSWSSIAVQAGPIGLIEPNALGWTPSLLSASGIDWFTVASGLAPIESATPGAQIALTLRQASGTSRYTFDASLTPEALVDHRRLPHAPAIARMTSWASASVTGSSRIAGRFGTFLAADHAKVQQTERDLSHQWTSRLSALTSHVTTSFDGGGRAQLALSMQDFEAPFEERRQMLDRRVNERGRYWQSGLGVTHSGQSGRIIAASLGWQYARLAPQIQDIRGGALDRVTEGRMPSIPWQTSDARLNAALALHPTQRSWRGMSHLTRAGVRFEGTRADAVPLAFPRFGELVNGLPARIWDPVGSGNTSRRTIAHVGVYAADRVLVRDDLTIDIGVRADYSSGEARGAAQDVSWFALSPRISGHWRRGPIGLNAGYRLYVDRLQPRLLAHGDPAEPLIGVYRWSDLDVNRLVDIGERGALVAFAGRNPAVASIATDLRPPRTREFSLGLDWDITRHLTFRGSTAWRRQTDLPGSINTGVTRADYDIVTIPDAFEDWLGPADDQPLIVYARRPSSFGNDEFLLTNPTDATATHEGIEGTWTWSSPRLRIVFGATAYKTRSWAAYRGFGPLENDHAAAGEVFENPNAQPVVQGSHFFDRSYVGKLSGSYRAPRDIRFGFAARYQDGQPFARVVVASDLPQGPEMVHAYRTARTRYTYTLTLDVRAEKGFTVRGRRAAVRVDVFNATRHLNEVEEDTVTGPAFRLSSAMQPPLTARLGLRFEW